MQLSLGGRGRLPNILIYGVAPLALAGIVAVAFVLSSSGKSVNAARTGFKAGSATASGQQQPQGSGSTATGSAPKAPASKTTKPGKRSSMPTGLLPVPSTGTSSGPGTNPGSKPRHSSKPKPKPAGPVTPTDLGQPNIDGYCGHIGQGSAVTTNSTAYGWACSSSSSVPVQVNSACAWTFHLKTSQVIDVTTDFHSATSWQCWRTNGMIGLLNIPSYCTSAGLGAAKLTADNAYGWTCGGNPIDTNAGCQAQSGKGDAFSRFEIWSDPNSWQCWD